MNETHGLTHERNKDNALTESSNGAESTDGSRRAVDLDSGEGGKEVVDAGRRMLNLHRGTVSGPSKIMDREGSHSAPVPASCPNNERGQSPRDPMSASGRAPQHDEGSRQQEFSGRPMRDEPIGDRQQLLEGANADCDDGDDDDDDEEDDEEEDDDGTMSKRKARPRRWTDDEDTALCKGVEKYGERRWKLIAAGVGTRDHMQCLQRWKKVLKRGLVKTQWMAHEDAILRHELETHMYKHGDSSSIDWVAVAGKLPLRSVKECRERWKYSLSSLALQWMQNSCTPPGAACSAPSQADGRHSHMYGDGLQPQLARPPPRVPSTTQQSQPPLSRADMVSMRHSQAPRAMVGGESAINGLSPSPSTRPGQPAAPHQGVGLDAGPIEASPYAPPHGVPSSQQSPPTPQVHARYVSAVPQMPAWQPTENVGDLIQQRLNNVQRVMETAMREVTTLCQIVSSRNEPRSVGDRDNHAAHGNASDGVPPQPRLGPHSSGDQSQASQQALSSQLASQQQSRQKDMQSQEQQQQAQPPQSRQIPLLHSCSDGLPLPQHLNWIPGNYSGGLPTGLPPGNPHHANYLAEQNHSASYGRYSSPPYSHFGPSPSDNSGYYDRQI